MIKPVGQNSAHPSPVRRRRKESSWMKPLGVFLAISFIAFNTYAVLRLADGGSQGMPVEGAADTAQNMHSSMNSSPYGLFVNEGPAVALPSIRISGEDEKGIDRKIYGGKGDKAHLGGFTAFDPMGVSPTLWAHMVNKLGIKSIMDVGCGRGISTSWFIIHGLEYVVCAEGSHDAVEQSLLPNIKNVPEKTEYEIVEHDFSRGPWWPSRTVDAVWCVEFTEHVGRNFQPNYITAWRKSALIFMTHSLWGGWHHVEVHDSTWWIVRMEAMGFQYSEILTKEMRSEAAKDSHRSDFTKKIKEGGKNVNAGQHLRGTLLVFINPLVASRIEHAHLFAEHGCNSSKNGREQECGKAGLGGGVEENTPLPDSYKALPMTKEMDDAWHELIWEL